MQAQVGIGADAVQSVFGHVSHLIDGVGAKVGQFLRLQVAPHVLDGIEVRWCAGKSGEVLRMQESYGKGVAIRVGPELCVVSRKAGGEALVGVRAGRVLSPEIIMSGVPTPSPEAEGNIPSIDSARWTGTPRGRRPRACTETPRTRTGRSQVFSSSPSGRALERSGKSGDVRH
jgi:hypothetical protein